MERLIQIGTVTALDEKKLKVRVKFQNINMTSGWLSVLQFPGMTVCVEKNISENSHSHAAFTRQWMPEINDTVVVIYLPVFNSDGFVVGSIGGE